MTADDFFPPCQLFSGDELQLSFPYDWRTTGDVEEHSNDVSQEIRHDLALVAEGSRDRAIEAIKQRRSDRQLHIDKLVGEIDDILPRIRDLLWHYYLVVRRHLEETGRTEDLKSTLRAGAARRRDHNLQVSALSHMEASAKRRLLDRAYQAELNRIERSGGFAHLDMLVRGLWIQICHGAEWAQVLESLDNIKGKSFLPDHADEGLRLRLEPHHRHLRAAQWSLYRIHERGEMEAQYWSAYLEGMPVAPADRSIDAISPHSASVSIHEKRVFECGSYIRQHGFPEDLEELRCRALSGDLEVFQLGTFRKSIGFVKLESGESVYKPSSKQGRKDTDAERETMKRMVEFYRERTGEKD